VLEIVRQSYTAKVFQREGLREKRGQVALTSGSQRFPWMGENSRSAMAQAVLTCASGNVLRARRFSAIWVGR
jgi:hypothetical protein